MFERCRAWQRMLSRRADGSLPERQWMALENHLAHCARCRATAEADRTLHVMLNLYTGRMEPTASEAFDARVLAALRGAPVAANPLARCLRALQTHWSTLSFGYFYQIAGGALMAASITALCLLPALSPGGPHTVNASGSIPALSQRNEPPVPLESLLRSPAPRAALLWSFPSVARPPMARALPANTPPHAAPKPRKTSPPSDKQGALPGGALLG